MLTNYIKIAIRNILRNKLHSFINIMGLSIGLTCTILILLFVLYEFSYDRHNSKHDRIYMVLLHQTTGDEEILFSAAPFPLAPIFREEYPFIEQVARTMSLSDKLFFIDQDGEIINEKNIRFADPEIFQVLDHKFIYGSSEGALDLPNSIVINKTLAGKYFGKQNPVGKILSTNNGLNYTIKGVFEDLPQNTSMPYDGLITMRSLGRERLNTVSDSFSIASSTIYILLRKNNEISNITEDYERFKNKYMGRRIPNINIDLKFLRLADYHLHYNLIPNLTFDNLGRLYILSLSAFFILIIACINYMNLATAGSMRRAREVGVRKALGADRGSLTRQFLMESMIISVFSMVIALVLVEVAMPIFNNFVSRELSFNITGNVGLSLSIIVITIIVGLLSGSYPAMVLSSFLPEKALRKGINPGATNKGLSRKILVVMQYSISIVIIICMMLSIKQMSYLKNMDPGFNKDDVFYISLGYEQVGSGPVLKEVLSKHSGISAVAGSSFSPTLLGLVTGPRCKIEDAKGEFVELQVEVQKVDHDYIDLIGMKVLEGSSFNREMGDDKSGVLINETFARSMGWDDSPIGKGIVFEGSIFYDGYYHISGIFKDVRGSDLDNKVRPVILMLDNLYNRFYGLSYITMKIHPEKSAEVLKYIRNTLKELYPLDTPEILSLEDDINNRYMAEKMVAGLLIYSAIFCTLISCLGLFGLSLFIAENKTKEIGIRKVNGASVQGIVFHLTGGFLKLVLIACIIACPISYWVMDKWFERFVYKVGMAPWIFVLAICMAIIIAWLTVSYHSIKAAMTDPVKALRYE